MEPGTYLAAATPLPVFLGTCTPCQRPMRVRDEEYRGDGRPGTCPDCAGAVALERVYGTTSRMTCDPRCEGATGPSCSCGCGGINHGGAWSKSGEMLAGALARYRDAQAKRAEAARKRADAAQRKAKTAFDEWYDDANAAGDLTWLDEVGRDVDGFLGELAERVDDGKMLTERQLACVPRNRKWIAEREARRAERAERDATAAPVPAGRREVTGVVLSVKVEDSPFGHDRTVVKMLVDAGDFRLYGTQPRSLYGAERGDRVTFTATLEPKAGENGFGFFSRPAKAALVPPAEGAPARTSQCESCGQAIWQVSSGRWYHRRNASESCGQGSVSWAAPAKAAV